MAFPLRPIPNIKIEFTKLFINNEFVDSVSGKTFEVENPCTEKIITSVSEAGEADVDKAVECARKAFQRGSDWRNLDAHVRGDLIYKLGNLIEEHANEIGSIECLEEGKTFIESHTQACDAANAYRYYGGMADKIDGRTTRSEGKVFAYTRREPIGVVAILVQWNYSVLYLSFKLALALAAGCTVIVKPAQQTPLTALYFAHLVKKAGFPPGVINFLPGYAFPVETAIANHLDIDHIGFTGPVHVGKSIIQASLNSNFKKFSLELGGKSPCVVFKDAILNIALKHIVEQAYFNAGQTCMAITRVFVQEEIYDEFLTKFIEFSGKYKVGEPFDPNVFQGPQIDLKSFEKVLRYIEIGKEEGAKCVLGGKRHGKIGYFIEPTLFTDVTDDMRIAKEEIFGPVLCLSKFNTLEEVITRANNNKYGLAAGVFTEHLNTAIEFANGVEASIVWINEWGRIKSHQPYGGTKLSGTCTDLGMESLNEYLNTKSVCIKLLRRTYL